MATYTGGSAEADHLCVLVHGLWGNANHMGNIAKTLRAQYPADKLYILVAKSNTGPFTYDGIELGGERLCLEIEEELQKIESNGGKIKKISVVGYSLGGLVARYTIGLLYAKSILDQLECMTFTAFASPFLGVRTPLRGWPNHIWNVFGARSLSKSGRQLFTIDKFRDTGRPLLAVLADPSSVFMKGLAKFKRRILYSNIVNDRSAVYYTTGISGTDPFVDLSNINVNYVKGYEDVIIDGSNPLSCELVEAHTPATGSAISGWARRIPFTLAFGLLLPIGVVAFLLTSTLQTIRSSHRISLHERGLAGIQIEKYRVPLLIKDIQGAVEDVYENINSAQSQDYLGTTSEEESDGDSNGVAHKESKADHPEDRKGAHHEPGTLALTPDQFAMIRGLDALGWRKYPVWIHKARHSHAAIIVRMEKEQFSEGRIVLGHWIKEEFLI